MKNILIIWKILNINLKRYDIVSCENPVNDKMIFWVKRKSKSCICPQCWIRTTKRQDLKEYKQKTNLKHINISNNTLIEIKPIKKYFRCNNCKSNFLERFDFESNIWFHTKTFENYVVASFWYTSWNQIAKLNQVSASKINKNSNKNDVMQKYKEKALQRLKSEDINPKVLVNKKWFKIEYKEITLDYFLETWYRKLFLTREKNLSPFQKPRLNQIFREYDYNGYLAETRTIKEDFMDAIDDLNMEEVDRILNDCKKSEHHRLKQFWRTLTNWYDWIKWFCEHSTQDFKFTNAYTEGYNLVCKNLKRQAHWFRFKSTYFKKILAKSMINKTKNKLLYN